MSIHPMAGSSEIDGEPILLRAVLSPKWQSYRAYQQACAFASIGLWLPGFLMISLPYLLCCSSARKEEAESFSLVVTRVAMHVTQKCVRTGFIISDMCFLYS